jgi:2-dehydro-3-deoxyglucarate aldolase
MPIRTNRLKQTLRDGQPVFGGLLRTPEPTLVEVLGYAGSDEYFKAINEEVVVVLMLEEAEAVESIDAITDVQGITALSIGLSDLSGSLGVPGQANHPSVKAAVDKVMGVAARKGVPVSLSVRSLAEVRDALKRGARLASVGTLETVLYQAVKTWIEHVKQ